jgi:hypothetical protein
VGGQPFRVDADLRGVRALARDFAEEHAFRVRLRGRGAVRTAGDGSICADAEYGTAWTDALHLPDDGILSLDRGWQNNCINEAYDVRLEMQHLPPGDDDWDTQPVIELDHLLLRMNQGHRKCWDSDHTYDLTCNPWEDGSRCSWLVE